MPPCLLLLTSILTLAGATVGHPTSPQAPRTMAPDPPPQALRTWLLACSGTPPRWAISTPSQLLEALDYPRIPVKPLFAVLAILLWSAVLLPPAPHPTTVVPAPFAPFNPVRALKTQCPDLGLTVIFRTPAARISIPCTRTLALPLLKRVLTLCQWRSQQIALTPLHALHSRHLLRCGP